MAVLGREHLRAGAAAELQVTPRLSWRLLAAAVLVVGVAALVPVLQTSSATERGGAIRGLEQERTRLQALLHDREVEMAALTSTSRVRREAIGRLHMVPAERVLYVTVDGELPGQRFPERLLIEHEDRPVAEGGPWWQELLDLLPLP